MHDALLYQRGTVVGLDGDSGCVIEFEFPAGCSACAGGLGCGLAPLAGLLSGQRRKRLTVPIRGQTAVDLGDSVRVGIDAGRFLLIVALTYAMPLFGLLTGALIAAVLASGSGDAGVLAGAVAGGVLSAGLLLAVTGRKHSLTWLGARVVRLP